MSFVIGQSYYFAFGFMTFSRKQQHIVNVINLFLRCIIQQMVTMLTNCLEVLVISLTLVADIVRICFVAYENSAIFQSVGTSSDFIQLGPRAQLLSIRRFSAQFDELTFQNPFTCLLFVW